MASIYTNVDVDVDIEIDEFVDSCNPREIKDLVNYLTAEGHLEKTKDLTKMTATEIDFCDKMSILSDKFYQMSVEEIEFIETLYNKYK